LSLAAVTPEVANVLAANPSPVNLTLVGNGPLPDAVLRTLLMSRLNLTLREAEELTPEQIRIVAEALADTTVRPGVVGFATLSLPNLQKLDSALLAETLAKANGFNFPASRRSRPRPPRHWAAFPDQEFRGPDGIEIRPSGDLNFPSLKNSRRKRLGCC
jgi:hypothetical protein